MRTVDKKKSSPKRLTHKERLARRKDMAAKVKFGVGLAKVSRMFGVSLATVRAACNENSVSWK